MRTTPRRVIALATIAVATLFWGASPSVARLTGTSGDVQVLNQAPADVSPEALTSDTQAFVFTERQCETLTANLPVDVLNPTGTYRDTATQPGVIPAGTRVDSYYVHFDQPGTAGTESVTGTLTFDQPVLGIIFLTPTLNATDAAVGAPGTTYPTGANTAFRGYEGPSDTVQVSADRLTVTFTATVGAFQDELRIITQGTCFPTDKEQCKKGGWQAFGFRNQGQCVSWVVSQRPDGQVPS